MPGERVAVGGEGVVEVGPVLRRQHAFSERQDLLLLERHVGEIELHIALRRLLEGLPARLAHHLEAEQRMLEIAYVAFTAGVVRVEVVQEVA